MGMYESVNRWMPPFLKLPSNPLALRVCLCVLGSTMLENVYNTYATKIFLERYRIDDASYNLAQIVFLVCNAVNDPLAGYFQDRTQFFANRGKVMAYSSALYALCHLAFWWPWGAVGSSIVGIQYVIVLCVYDSLYGIALLEYVSLCCELSVDYATRCALAKWGVVARIIAAFVIIPHNLYSDSSRIFFPFQVGCAATALLAGLCMWFSGWRVNYGVAQTADRDQRMASSSAKLEEAPVKEVVDNSSHNPERVVRGETGAGDFLKLSFQVLLNRSVLSYVATNYIMQMAFVAFGGWLVIYLEHLAPTLDPTVRAVFISCTLWVPFTVSIGLADYAVYVGVFWINYWSFVIRAASGGLAVLVYRAGLIGTIGDDSFNYALLTYLMFQAILNLGPAMLWNVLSADMIDDDFRRHKRDAPLSSIFHGINALITKPGQSVAPMLVLAYLTANGYRSGTAAPPPENDMMMGGNMTMMTTTMASAISQPETESSPELKQAMLNLMAFMPVAIGLGQMFVFAFYGLKNTHKKPAYMDEA